jgi:hypothetical protein
MTEQLAERRPPSAELLELVKQVHDNQLAMDAKLTKHMTEETVELAEAIASLMKDAFPEGDPGGHRRHHELVIKAAEEKAEFWQKMRIALSQYGLLGFAGWAFWVLWAAFLQGPHK